MSHRTERRARWFVLAGVAAACLGLPSVAWAATFNATPSTLGFVPDSPGPTGTPGDLLDIAVPVSGFGSGGPSRVEVTITAEHASVGDLRLELISPEGMVNPTGRSKVIFSRVGSTSGPGDESTLDGTYVFADAAPASPTWWGKAASTAAGQRIISGFSRASLADGANTTILAGFTSVSDLNGTWTLRVSDARPGSIGQITAASIELIGPVAATPSSLGAIPDDGTNKDVTFSLNGYNAAPSSVAVAMTFNPTHSYAGDLDATLIAPNSASATIFSRTGSTVSPPNGDSSDLIGPYRFFDNNSNGWAAAAVATGATAAIPAGNYRTSSAGSAANTSINPTFAGVSNPNGTWTLRFRDLASGDTGGLGAAELSIIEGADNTAPPAPSLSTTEPASPSPSNNPRFKGSAAAGTIVRLHDDPFNCGPNSIVAAGSPELFAGAGIPVDVVNNSSVRLAASTIDASGNTSGCSSHLEYIEDSDAPDVPAISGTDPPSPANNNFPKIKGTLAEPGSTVRIFDGGDCSEPAAQSGPAATFNTDGIELEVPGDSTVDLRVTATDAAGNASACSDPVIYTEDSTATTPTLDNTDPRSPANDNELMLSGFGAEPGGLVSVYADSACTGLQVLDAPAAELNGAGIALTVADDTTTVFRVLAYDALGNVSTCSNALAYTEDSTAPAAPTLSGTSPASGSNVNRPKAQGTAEAGSSVVVLGTADCTGQPLGVGTAEELGGGGIELSVSDNTTTSLSALATDAAGNLSTCSASINYAEVTPILSPGPGLDPPGDQDCDQAKANLAKAKEKLKKAKESGKKNRIKKAKKKVKAAKKAVGEACG